jgi:hypothetical protein
MNNTYQPSVNIVVLSFVDPVKLMNLTNDSTTVNGIPFGMTTLVVNYFESRGIRVMMSIGGASFVSHWDKALKANPTQLGINAANAAKQFNVGMEIDYEKSSNPDTRDLQKFVSAYRSVIPYDATGANFAAQYGPLVALANEARREHLQAPADPNLSSRQRIGGKSDSSDRPRNSAHRRRDPKLLCGAYPRL